jgi:hypothetical protein
MLFTTLVLAPTALADPPTDVAPGAAADVLRPNDKPTPTIVYVDPNNPEPIRKTYHEVRCTEAPCGFEAIVASHEILPGTMDIPRMQWNLTVPSRPDLGIVTLETSSVWVAGQEGTRHAGHLNALDGYRVLVADHSLLDEDEGTIEFAPERIFVSSARENRLSVSSSWGMPMELTPQGLTILDVRDHTPNSQAQWNELTAELHGLSRDDRESVDEKRRDVYNKTRKEAIRQTWREACPWDQLVEIATTLQTDDVVP